MHANTRPTLSADSPFHPPNAVRIEPNEAIHTVHCTVLKRFHYQGFACWEFYHDDGGQPAKLYQDDAEMAAALVAYPLLEMDPQERRDVDLTITYQWQRGAGARAGRRKLIAICEKERSEMGQPTVEATSELDAAFPRDENNQPVDDAPAKPTYKGHTAVPDEAIHAIPNHVKRELELSTNEQGKHIRACFGMSVVEYVQKFGVEKAWDATLEYVAEHKSGETADNATESTPAAIPIQGTASDAPSAPAKAQETANETPTDKPAVSGMSEAGFSMNFFWVDEDGEEAQFTMREATWQAGLDAVPQFKARLRAMGYMPKAEWLRKQGGQPAAAQQASAPAANADSGKAACVLVKVGRTFKNDKDQLTFECAGFEDPLKYSAKDTAAFLKITAGLRKADGSPITAADLTQGAKLAVSGKVLWKKSEDGKYNNVMGTEAA